jgi:hypothetical protein
VELSTHSINFSQDVSHACFKACEGGKVAWPLVVVPWERANTTSVVAGPSPGDKSEISLSWATVFSVAH